MVGEGAHISIDGVTVFHFCFLFKFGPTIKPLSKKKSKKRNRGRKKGREGGRDRGKERTMTNEKQKHLAQSTL